MIVREFHPRSTRRNGKNIVRIKFCESTTKKTKGKVIINTLHFRSSTNVRITMGLCDLKGMIKQFEKQQESKLRK